MRALAALISVAVACGGTPAPPPGQPGNASAPAGDVIARFDAEVAAALGELDRAKRGVARGPALVPDHRVAVPLTADPAAPAPWVSVTYFYELACKFCYQARDALREVRALYNNDRVVFVPRVLVVHRAQAMAAHLVACAAQRHGHDVTEAMWARAFAARDYTSANLLAIAADGGVPAADVVDEIGTGACLAAIIGDHALAIRTGLSGTPTFFINGLPLEGLPDKKVLADLIGGEMQRVEAHLATGGDVAGYHAGWRAQAHQP